jgi:murein DD-endopeptidase MepM/ murein hydrolase activator NlpD
MKKTTTIGHIAALFFFAGISACSTVPPQPSERQGLLDRLAMYDERYGKKTAQEISGDESARSSTELTSTQKRVTLIWPLINIRVTSPFGQRGSEFHEGLDLRAPNGTSVYAATSGRVLYSGSRIHGYGNMILIKHSSGISTVYAHNSRLLVRRGQWVRQGQKISYSGRTGHVTAPHLHFEVRNGTTAVDPIRYLPRAPEGSVADDEAAGKKRKHANTQSRAEPRVRSHDPHRHPAAVAVNAADE